MSEEEERIDINYKEAARLLGIQEKYVRPKNAAWAALIVAAIGLAGDLLRDPSLTTTYLVLTVLLPTAFLVWMRDMERRLDEVSRDVDIVHARNREANKRT